MKALLVLKAGMRTAICAGLFLPGVACGSQSPAGPAAADVVLALATPTSVATPVVINEILAHTDEPQRDAIELYNQTGAPVDIGGWYVTDDQDKPPEKWFSVPAGTLIPAQGYYVTTDEQWQFRLSEFGETVYLYQPDGAGKPGLLVDKAPFGVSPNGISLGRHVTSTGAVHYPLQRGVTLGAANAGPAIAPLVISEIMYHPVDGSEFLIITNRGQTTVPLYDPENPADTWHIAGLDNNNDGYALPAGLQLATGASLVVADDPDAFRAAYAEPLGTHVVGPFSGKLSNEGERLALQQPQPPEANNGFVAYADVDIVEYGSSAPWPPEANSQGLALQRVSLDTYGDDPANWRAGDVQFPQSETAFLPLVTR